MIRSIVSKPPRFFISMRKYLFFTIILLLLFTSCVTTRRAELESAYVPDSFEWEEVCPGVARYDFENRGIPLIYHAVKIDLNLVDLICARGVRAADFAASEKPVVLINANPFDKSGTLVGLHREAGRNLSAPVARYAAIGFRENEARVFESQVAEELEDFDYAFGGFFVVLKDGEVCGDFLRRGDSRSGAGVTADGRTLYLLVVEGERPQKSRGLSYPQCGEIFLAMGCRDALEFDGGGSSDLCINGRSVMSYRVSRVHGNCFGFKLR